MCSGGGGGGKDVASVEGDGLRSVSAASFPARSVIGSVVGGEERWRDDAASGALVAEEFPLVLSNELAEGWRAGSVGGFGRLDEIEWSLEEEGGVREGDSVSPGDVFAGVRDFIGEEFDVFVAVDNAVFPGGVSVPEWPPSTVVLGKGAVR